MKFRRKIAIGIISCVFIVSLFLIFIFNKTNTISLIPLDSRPPNTHFPETLAGMASVKMVIPHEYLDNFLTPASTEELWAWLEEKGQKSETIIINTNQLFQGGLISSRHPDFYNNTKEKIQRLKEFCLKNKNKKIIIITVMPRLLPSQFSDLWTYHDELIAYAQEVDKLSLLGIDIVLPPKNVPNNIIERYLRVYQETAEITDAIISFANEGLIDQYLIGQDDAEEYGLSNKIIRSLAPSFNEKVRFVHGADELTMLVLAKEILPNLKEKIAITYINPELKNTFFPFEASPLEDVINTKLDYLNLRLSQNSPISLIIHNDSTQRQLFFNEVHEKTATYLGIMDIAYTNKGDAEIYDFFLTPAVFKKVKGYAGWNTAGNAVGTELAHLLFYQNLKENYNKFSPEDKKLAAASYVKFKYMRIAEDLVYLGLLKHQLNNALIKKDLDPNNLNPDKSEAELLLKELYLPYQKELNQLFLGDYEIGDFKFTVDSISSDISLPWARTFECKVVVDIFVTVK